MQSIRLSFAYTNFAKYTLDLLQLSIRTDSLTLNHLIRFKINIFIQHQHSIYTTYTTDFFIFFYILSNNLNTMKFIHNHSTSAIDSKNLHSIRIHNSRLSHRRNKLTKPKLNAHIYTKTTPTTPHALHKFRIGNTGICERHG